jgi:hypothetical protein
VVAPVDYNLCAGRTSFARQHMQRQSYPDSYADLEDYHNLVADSVGARRHTSPLPCQGRRGEDVN